MTEKTVTATLRIDPTKYSGNGWFEENMQISININRNCDIFLWTLKPVNVKINI